MLASEMSSGWISIRDVNCTACGESPLIFSSLRTNYVELIEVVCHCILKVDLGLMT